MKNFLVQYYEVCRREGYSPVQDPLSIFYEALSVGSNKPDKANYFMQVRPGLILGQQNNTEAGGGSNQAESMDIHPPCHAHAGNFIN